MATENGPYQVASATGKPSGAIDLCPYLHLAGDPDTAATYARADHRCVRLGEEAISSPWQRQYCVSRSHVRCPYYLGQGPSSAHRAHRHTWRKRLRNVARIAGIAIGVVLLVLVVLQLTTDYALLGRLPVIGGFLDDSSSAPRTRFISQPASDPSPLPTLLPPMSRSIENDLGLENPWRNTYFEDVPGFADDSFEALWMRTDEPVRDLNINRSWVWGPAPVTAGVEEEWIDARDGTRIVQYFPKGRMEHYSGSISAPPWLLSGGLLVSEMIQGRYQIGDDAYNDELAPPDVPVAGSDPVAGLLTYAEINRLELSEKTSSASPGDLIDATVVDGRVERSERYAEWDVSVGEMVEETNHAIADVFSAYLDSRGTIYEDGEYRSGPLFEHRFHLVGFPITEAYWASVEINGDSLDVLWQCFERRCLTYVPSNDLGWQIESGNAGLHYYQWRYGEPD